VRYTGYGSNVVFGFIAYVARVVRGSGFRESVTVPGGTRRERPARDGSSISPCAVPAGPRSGFVAR
jgi:hypothetical protein